MVLPRSGLRRNTQDLARVDLVGVRQHGLVGFEDLVVLGALAFAVMGFRNLPKRVALDDGVHGGFRSRLFDRQLVVDGRHAPVLPSASEIFSASSVDLACPVTVTLSLSTVMSRPSAERLCFSSSLRSSSAVAALASLAPKSFSPT